jgi:hypothetical protein
LASLNVAQPSIVILAKSLFGDVTFRPRLARFETEYARNVKFRALIDEAVDKFLIRKRAGALHNNEVRDHCVSYQLEELALFELLVERGYGVLIYAGAQLPIMKAIVSRSLDGVPTSLADLTLVELRSFRPR